MPPFYGETIYGLLKIPTTRNTTEREGLREASFTIIQIRGAIYLPDFPPSAYGTGHPSHTKRRDQAGIRRRRRVGWRRERRRKRTMPQPATYMARSCLPPSPHSPTPTIAPTENRGGQDTAQRRPPRGQDGRDGPIKGTVQATAQRRPPRGQDGWDGPIEGTIQASLRGPRNRTQKRGGPK